MTRDRTLLPHVFALLYALAIAYASLQPFAPWIQPDAATPFWVMSPAPGRWWRFDTIVNAIAYVPLGVFVALMPRGASPAMRAAVALLAGAILSFGMETLQMYMPPRDAAPVDWIANSVGALLGGIVGAALARTGTLRQWASVTRTRVFLPGTLGDLGLGLLVLWLVAQLNPAVALFAVNYDVGPPVQGNVALAAPFVDRATPLLEGAESAFQLLGVGLFLALLVRERRYVGGAVLVLIGMALAGKGLAATLLVKSNYWEWWLKPWVAVGIAAGALLLLFAISLPRAAQVTACAVALLASLLLPVLGGDERAMRAPVALYQWRYGHLLNFDGLTHTVLLAWPLAASLWLFLLAGRPAWGRSD